MSEIRVTVGFKCTTKEKEAIESIAKSQGMTISEYLKLRVSEPRVPKKAKSRNTVRSLSKITELLYSENPLLSDKEKIDIMKEEVKNLWKNS